MLRALTLALCIGVALSGKARFRPGGVGHRFADTSSSKLVGGEETQPNEYPYQVSFQYSSGGHFCGGIVYDEMNVISAAHCCTSSASSVRIVAGDHSLSDENKGTEQFRDVATVTQHEDYFGTSNDVCMLGLAEPLDLNEFVQPVAMPSQDQQFEDGLLAVLSGWGALGSGSSAPDSLYAVDIQIVSDDACAQAYEDLGLGFFVPEDEICAGVDGPSACYGDSGGPMVCDGLLCGVVSWGYDCDTYVAPAVFAEASHYVNWFRDNAASK